jgi:hypothetical protein
VCSPMGFAGTELAARFRVLTEAPNAFIREAAENHDGTGFAGFIDGALQVSKSAESGVTSSLMREAPQIAGSPSMVGHLRFATVGDVNALNAHPYASRDDGFAFVHNGQVENVDALKHEIGEDVASTIKSTNDSAFYGEFAMREIHDKGYDEGIRSTVHWLDKYAPDSTSGNFLVVGADGTLAGVRTHELRTLGISPTGIEAARLGAADLGREPGFYVTKKPASATHPWTALKPREAFVIDPDLKLHTFDIS